MVLVGALCGHSDLFLLVNLFVVFFPVFVPRMLGFFLGRVGRRRKQCGACPYRNGVARRVGGGIFTGGVQVLPSSENGASDMDRPRREYRREFGKKIETEGGVWGGKRWCVVCGVEGGGCFFVWCGVVVCCIGRGGHWIQTWREKEWSWPKDMYVCVATCTCVQFGTILKTKKQHNNRK